MADLAIVPVQDVLGLGSEARMNTPGTSSGNWRWRLKPGQLKADALSRLAQMTSSMTVLPIHPRRRGSDDCDQRRQNRDAANSELPSAAQQSACDELRLTLSGIG